MSLEETQRIIVDQIDPLALVPGGTDTCIADMLKYSPAGTFKLVGITNNASDVGKWKTVQFGTHRVDFIPVARIDRTSQARFSVPHSFLLALGIIKFRAELPQGVYQAHRIEIGFVLSRLLRRPLIQFIHNDSKGLTGPHSDSIWKRLRWLYYALETDTLQSAEQVVLFNKTDAPRVRKKNSHLAVTETWFDPIVFSYRVKDRPASELNVCWVGRFESQKDPLLAVQAFSHLRTRNPQAHLSMVGSGALLADAQILASRLGLKEHISFLGPQSRESVATVFHESSVMLLCSYYEGSPRVVAEAAATGLPIAITQEADTDSIIVNGVNGWVSADRDPKSIANAIIESANCHSDACRSRIAHRSAPVSIAKLLET